MAHPNAAACSSSSVAVRSAGDMWARYRPNECLLSCDYMTRVTLGPFGPLLQHAPQAPIVLGSNSIRRAPDTVASDVDLDHRPRERLRISSGPATAAAAGPARHGQHAAQSKPAERRRRRATGLTQCAATPAGPPAIDTCRPLAACSFSWTMKKPLHSTGCALGLATNYGRRILVCAKPSLFWSSWRPRSQRRVCRYRLSIGSWCASKAATPLEKPACPARWWIRYTPRSGLELEPGGAARVTLGPLGLALSARVAGFSRRVTWEWRR